MPITKDARRELRANLMTDIEVSLSPEILKATTVDISAGGFRMETDTPLNVQIRFLADEFPEVHEAQLVWVKQTEDGRMEYGFRYTGETP
jgi:hypothetical protein